LIKHYTVAVHILKMYMKTGHPGLGEIKGDN